MEKNTILRRFQKKAIQLGGRLNLVSHKKFNDTDGYAEGQLGIGPDGDPEWAWCPFNSDIAINYIAKTIMFNRDSNRKFEPGHLCHEFGHIFATNTPPSRADEYSFLAWEMLLAKEMGVFEEWKVDQKDYYLNGDKGMHDIGDAVRQGRLDEVFKDAKKVAGGNIKRGKIVSVRK
jgi:hypothetical protein